jgi:hypothetical protein
MTVLNLITVFVTVAPSTHLSAQNTTDDQYQYITVPEASNGF